MKKTILLFFLIFFFLGSGQVKGQSASENKDSLKISLLTCYPGNESYSLYGHTALRIQNLTNGEDIVFNYGLFSFESLGFIWKFILGDTQYFVGAEFYSDFARSYEKAQRQVKEQVLNLNQKEAKTLQTALINNCSTPNWTYHYNYLKDNCTTRAVNMILNNAFRGTSERVIFTPLFPHKTFKKTYRDIIHEFAKHRSPWTTFGQDLILGSNVDTIINFKNAASFPLYALQLFRQGQIISSHNTTKPLVSSEETIILGKEQINDANFFTPLYISILLLAFCCIISWLQILNPTKKRVSLLANCLDYGFMFLQGSAGLIIFILFFFSVQPSVNSNWLILTLNPIPLIWIPIKWWKSHKGKRDIYMPYIAPILSILCFIPSSFMQVIPTAMQLLALCLLTRGVTANIIRHKEQSI